MNNTVVVGVDDGVVLELFFQAVRKGFGFVEVGVL